MKEYHSLINNYKPEGGLKMNLKEIIAKFEKGVAIAVAATYLALSPLPINHHRAYASNHKQATKAEQVHERPEKWPLSPAAKKTIETIIQLNSEFGLYKDNSGFVKRGKPKDPITYNNLKEIASYFNNQIGHGNYTLLEKFLEGIKEQAELFSGPVFEKITKEAIDIVHNLKKIPNSVRSYYPEMSLTSYQTKIAKTIVSEYGRLILNINRIAEPDDGLSFIYYAMRNERLMEAFIGYARNRVKEKGFLDGLKLTEELTKAVGTERDTNKIIEIMAKYLIGTN